MRESRHPLDLELRSTVIVRVGKRRRRRALAPATAAWLIAAATGLVLSAVAWCGG